MSSQSDFTAPEEEAGQRQDYKNWDGIGKKEHERFVPTLVTLSRHAIVAGIARATPATEPSEQCSCQSSSLQEGENSSCGGPAVHWALACGWVHLASVYPWKHWNDVPPPVQASAEWHLTIGRTASPVPLPGVESLPNVYPASKHDSGALDDPVGNKGVDVYPGRASADEAFLYNLHRLGTASKPATIQRRGNTKSTRT